MSNSDADEIANAENTTATLHSTRTPTPEEPLTNPPDATSMEIDFANGIVPSHTISLSQQFPKNVDEVLFKLTVDCLPDYAKQVSNINPIVGNTPSVNALLSGSIFHDNSQEFRPPTILEQVQALCEGKGSNSEIPQRVDDASNAGLIPDRYRFATNLAQNLTLALNIDHVFTIPQLSNRDFAHIDAYLKDDLFITFRELVTKQIITPTPNQIKDGLNGDFTVFAVTQALKALNNHCKALTSLHIEVTQTSWDSVEKMLCWINNSTTLIANINCQRSIIERKLIPRIFDHTQDLSRLASALANFGVSPLKIDSLFTDADATSNYAYEIISKLTSSLQSRLANQTQTQYNSHAASNLNKDTPSGLENNTALESRGLQAGQSTSSGLVVPTSPPPNYRGCIFCGSRIHYTALCPKTRRLTVRARFLAKGGRCIKCMSRHEPGQCKRRSWCLNCHSYTHHQAVCSYGDVIINDVDGPLEEYYEKMSELAEEAYCSYQSRKRARHDDEE
ncbi:hypothetical protein Aduo_015647 [Ancylostoma duodenale]